MATPNVVPRADSEGGLGTASKYWASAYVDNVFVSKIGRDADNLIDFSADNQISIRVNAANELKLNATSLFPVTSDGTSLGQAANQWSDLFLASGAVINFDNGDIALTHSGNTLEFTGGLMRFTDDQKLTFGNGNDLQIFHEAGGTSKVENYVGNLVFQQRADDSDIVFQCDNGSGGLTEYLRLDGSAAKTTVHRPLKFDDNISAEYGTDVDMIMYHSGSNGLIENYNGNFKIIQHQTDKDIIFQSDDGSGGVTAYITLDGSEGHTVVHKEMQFENNIVARFGNSNAGQIYHSSSVFQIDNIIGNMAINNFADDGDIIFSSDNGAGGTATYFYLDGSSATHDGSATTGLFTNWPDKSKISLGTSHDLQITHNGNDSFIHNFTGDLYIKNDAADKDIIFQSDDGSGGVATYLTLDGSVAKNVFGKPIEVGSDGAGHDAKFFLAASGRHIMIDADDNSLVFTDNANAKFGNSGSLQISHTGTDARIDNMVGHLKIRNYSDDSDIYFESDNGSGGVTEYFRVDGGEETTIFSQPIRINDNVRLNFGDQSDLVLRHNGTDAFLTNGTGDLKISNNADDKDIIFSSDDGSGGLTEYFRLDGSAGNISVAKTLLCADNKGINIGASNDLQISHNGSNSGTIKNTVGNLTISNEADDGDIIFQSDDGSGSLITYFKLDGSLATHDGSANTTRFTKWEDNSIISLGTSNDARLYHNGADTYLDNLSGDYYIRQKADDKDIIFQSDDGSGGLATYFFLDGNAGGANPTTIFPDNSRLVIGSGQDLKLYHSPSVSYIDVQNGNLEIRQTTDDADIVFKCDDGSGGLTDYLRIDGSHQRLVFSNNIKATFGSSSRLAIQHDGTDASIMETNGDLRIINTADDKDIKFECDNGSGSTTEYLRIDGSEVSVKILTQKVIMTNLPTSDPGNSGQLWNDNGTLKISAG